MNKKPEFSKIESVPNDEFEEQYNALFTTDININKVDDIPQNIKSVEFNLDKELASSKRNIIIEDENKYLQPRKWGFLNQNKIKDIENKYEQICNQLNTKKLKSLKESIDHCELEYIYRNNFSPRVNVNKIGTLSSLNFLIETSFCCPEKHIERMFEDKKKLEKMVYKFRNILGDGDCFYRSVIFSLLENIVLSKNILFLKELFILFYENINSDNPLIKSKPYLEKMKKLNISITYQILYFLIKEMENDAVTSYKLLLKIFLYCPGFDECILYFTRYLYFDYILSNENKLYSTENKIEIGCFLPESFVIDKGETNDYHFEDYFCLQLMKPKTFAEKIVIYITPFIFNCDLNILLYDYGTKNTIEEKEFKSNLWE